jgi:hypothetical protein
MINWRLRSISYGYSSCCFVDGAIPGSEQQARLTKACGLIETALDAMKVILASA